MKTLLITNYWYPYNNPGAFRWLGFAKYIDFDVLTCKIPIRGFKDPTIPKSTNKTIRFGKKIPAIIWGLVAPFIALFYKYDAYIITSPPESLLFGAWLLQLLGKNVLVDMRDSINREHQVYKFLIPAYRFFYGRMNKIMVCWRFIDPAKPVVYTGYDEITKAIGARNTPLYYHCTVNRSTYLKCLRYGYVRDYSQKAKGYAASSFHTIKKLGYALEPGFHPEVYSYTPESYERGASKIIKILYSK